MISDNVKNIFSFLEFLNSNVEFFNTCIPLWEEVESLRRDYNNLKPRENYEHKFEREEIEKKGTEVFQNFKIKCIDVVNNKINELDIADLSNPLNQHFKYLGEFSALIHSQDYDKNDVTLIKEAKDNYISILSNLKLKVTSILPWDIITDFKRLLFDCFKPFFTNEEKLKLSKFKSFDEFLEFCKPQLTDFKLNSEIQKSIDNLNSTLYRTNEENVIDLLISNAVRFKSNNENSIKNYFTDNNIKMFLDGIERITDTELLQQLSLYFQFSDLLLNARNKLETIPLLKEIEKRSNSQPHHIIERTFSVLEWATIFYYADETKLTSSGGTKKSRMKNFMEKHQIETTISHFKNKFYDAKKRINDKSDYPIDKLELIIPFLNENYKQTVTKVENDITFLKENESDY